MDSNQSGGGDSLLESPQIDATIKVYCGGGREDTGARDETGAYLGVGGTPVQRHQVSLYTTPVKRRELKVYKGGGEKPMFRGKGIEEFQKNPQLYTSMIETGKFILNELGTTSLKGTGSVRDTLKKFNVFFYGEPIADTSQLLVFSTVLSRSASAVRDTPGTLGILVLEIDDGWTLRLPEDTDDIHTQSTQSTVSIGPYWLRNPETLTPDTFFSGLTKSELLYMNDILFKGYPYRLIKGVLLENKERFFT
jgi:hypothetical protein